MTAQNELILRLRTQLDEEPSVREQSMFGGRCFLVRNKIVASALKNGDLLICIPADRHAELAAIPGASRAIMRAGRPMGLGWLVVAGSAIGDDEQLSFWIDLAMEHNRHQALAQR